MKFYSCTNIALFICGTFLLLTFHRASAQSINALKQAAINLDGDPSLRSATWGLCVIDASNGQVLLNHHSNKSVVTASTMKAVTTLTALEVLGQDFRFETVLEYSGRIREGVLEGNLFIRGSGDPSFGSDRGGDTYELDPIIDTWVAAVQALGIRYVQGKVIADASIYSSQATPPKWSWEDMGNYYGAGAFGINVHENLYRLDLQPGPARGSSTQVIRTVPFIPEIQFINEITTGPVGSGDNAYIYGAPYTWLRYLRGTIPAGVSQFSIKGSIPDPSLFLARKVHDTLKKVGCKISGGFSTLRREQQAGHKHLGERKKIHTHSSAPLSALIIPTNQKSINLYAEAFLNQLAAHAHKIGNTKEGLKVLKNHWSKRGINTKGMLIRDGSGLSPNNAMSTLQMAQILSKGYQSPNQQAFFNSLPVSGRSGTLKNVARNTAAEGRLHAKSGFISGVRSYAGYCKTQSGRTLAFAMIANYYSCSAGAMRRKFEVLMDKMARVP